MKFKKEQKREVDLLRVREIVLTLIGVAGLVIAGVVIIIKLMKI